MLAVVLALLVLAASLVFLGLVGRHLFRRVISLGRAVADAGGRLAEAAAALDALRPDDDDR